MRVPKVHGVIGRRLLVNFSVDPDVIRRQLPAPFRPKLHDGHAVAGICLIRLEDIRPKRFPRMLGLSSENAAHRIAVIWDDDTGPHEGVYIPRRDTGSLMNHLAGGRLFPGEHQRASFQVEDTGDRISLEMRSADGRVRVDVSGRTATALPPVSIFGTIAAASAFFEPGSVGYSATAAGGRLDGVVLKTHTWSVVPLAMDRVFSSYFADESRFPAGAIAFDCALIMRNIAHEWQAGAPMYI
jgi:Uncharacterized conserved protein (COG2071)